MGYTVLRGKIAERGIKQCVIASALGISTRALRNKLRGTSPLKWVEACTIHQLFFPDIEKDDLFATTDQAS